MLLQGLEVEADVANATEWFQLAANQGHAEATEIIALLAHEQGTFFAELSTSEGYVSAAKYVGLGYEFGQVLPQSREQAVPWMRFAAQRGDSDAQYFLGNYYFFGVGDLQQDYAQAMRWYQSAGTTGSGNPIGQVGILYLNGYGMAQPNYYKAYYWCAIADDLITTSNDGRYNAEFRECREIARGELSLDEVLAAEERRLDCQYQHDFDANRCDW